MAETNIRVLNLGAGTQSSVLYLQMCRKEINPAHIAIFADTQWEPKTVYEQLEWLKVEGGGVVPIVVVTAGNLREDAIAFRQDRFAESGGKKRYASIPLFVLNVDGTKGMIRRQCTSEYKIKPIIKYIREQMMRLQPGERFPKGITVTHIYGISFDERQRMSAPSFTWQRHEYPLVDRKMRRQQVIEWAERYYPGRKFPRSACIGCPYHSDAEWRAIRETDATEFADAIEFDNAIRIANQAAHIERKQLAGLPFVHRSCKPLSEVNIDQDGPGLWDGVADNECGGICGV